MLLKLLTYLSLAMLALPLHAADTPEVSLTDLKPSARHLQATALVTHFIREYHYKKTQLDDALSEKIYQGFLKSLDPNRSFLLASDVEQIGAFEYRFDDQLRNVQLEPAFSIFKLFRKRLEKQMGVAIGLLDKGFDFDRDEDFYFDRTEADWAKDQQELDDIWRQRVKNDVLGLKLANKSDEDIADILRKRYERRVRGVTQLNADDVFQIFINAYTSAIEPHTSYFSPRTSENFKIHLSLSLEGIGAALRTENEFTVVQRIISGGPADKSGLLHPEDRITGVAQGDEPFEDVVAWRLEDVVDLIRGPKDSVVRLELLRKGDALTDKREVIELVRGKIKLEEQAVKHEVIEVEDAGRKFRIGVLDVPTFYLDSQALMKGEKDYRSTTRDAVTALDALKAENIDGLVVDLRGNGGGALTEAVQLTGLFIPTGPVVQVRDSGGHTKLETDTDPLVEYDGPLVVLVNRYSASASEIFSGAIQDYGRGLVVGEATFGKGTVQSLVDLNRHVRDRRGDLGQLKTTIAQFFRVNGESTQNRGVHPDITFPTAVSAEKQGESALENALPWAKVEAADYVGYQKNSELVSRLQALEKARVDQDPGFRYLLEQSKQANLNREKKSATLKLSSRQAEQEKKRIERLERRNRMRLALGLEPETLDEQEAAEEDGETVAESADAKDDKEDVPGDVWLKHSARIVADMVRLSGPPVLTAVEPSY